MIRTAAALLLLCSPANGTFYTYAEWDTMQSAPRAAYIAGVFDAMISFSSSEDEDKVNAHYLNCVRKTRMNNGQLSEKVRAFARTRPKVQDSVPTALVNYLIELCGAPP